jgi:hypothetical protein
MAKRADILNIQFDNAVVIKGRATVAEEEELHVRQNMEKRKTSRFTE